MMAFEEEENVWYRIMTDSEQRLVGHPSKMISIKNQSGVKREHSFVDC